MVPGDKPRNRSNAENETENLLRYEVGGAGPNATETLGIKVVYPNAPQGLAIAGFLTDSTAESGGIQLHDKFLEVDGSPVGHIRGRFYEPWQRFGRSGINNKTEVLVSFLDNNGIRHFYYPMLDTAVVIHGILPESIALPPDFFTVPKPRQRSAPENETKNTSRYTFGAANFDTFSPYELGVDVNYSEEFGGTVTVVKSGKAADRAGIKTGDMILEVDGAPVGQFGNRLYEIWRQYIYSKSGKVELLVVFEDPGTGEFRYYYPEIELDDRTSTN